MGVPRFRRRGWGLRLLPSLPHLPLPLLIPLSLSSPPPSPPPPFPPFPSAAAAGRPSKRRGGGCRWLWDHA